MQKKITDLDALSALIKVGTTINAHLDLDHVLSSIMQVTTEVMQVESSSLALENNSTGELIFHVVCGDGSPELLNRVRMKRGEGIIGWVVETGRATTVNDVAKDSRFCSKVDKESGFATRSILCVPLATPKRVLGAIEVINKIDGSKFDNSDLELCQAIAGQAAVAIENAMLHEEIISNERMTAIGQTIAGLGHCIKNVLNGIQGGAYILDMGLRKEEQDKILKGWKIVKKNNAFMQELVLDMLSYTKEREPECETCDINAIIESVCDMVEVKAREKGVSVSWSGSDELSSVIIDPKGIRRCILNLVSNGIDACENSEGDKNVRISINPFDESSFQLIISDTGCGISEDARKNLFKMFFSTKGSRGTGLGLAVTHKIIHEHGGIIDVESVQGKGTDFIITLPLKTTKNTVL